MITIEQLNLRPVNGKYGMSNVKVNITGELPDEVISMLFNVAGNEAQKFLNEHPKDCTECPANRFAQKIVRAFREINEEMRSYIN